MNEQQSDALYVAIMDVVGGLDLHSTLSRIAESARVLAHAKYAALGVLGESGKIEEFIFAGMAAEVVEQIDSPHPVGKGVLGLLMQHPVPIRVDHIAEHPASVGFPNGHPPMDSFLGVPIRVRGSVFGNLYLTEKLQGGSFSKEDEQLVELLAGAAGLAIENARLFGQAEQIGIYQDRERIARDLHDLVIQRLFATGLSLQAVLRKDGLDEDLTKRLNQSIDDLDQTVKQLRQTIYALRASEVDEISLRRRVMLEVEQYAKLLGTTPALTFDGAVDTMTPDRISDQLIAALRELLSNAVKHAKAEQLSVSVRVLEKNLELVVADDGIGISDNARKSGLANLKVRAEALGGNFETSHQWPSGTKASWRVPLS